MFTKFSILYVYFSDIADGVTGRWQQLVTRAEERHKLVTASLNFYKTAEQVNLFILFFEVFLVSLYLFSLIVPSVQELHTKVVVTFYLRLRNEF